MNESSSVLPDYPHPMTPKLRYRGLRHSPVASTWANSQGNWRIGAGTDAAMQNVRGDLTAQPILLDCASLQFTSKAVHSAW